MKTLKYQMDLRKQGLGLNHPDKELFLNHKQFLVAELLTHFEKLTKTAPIPEFEKENGVLFAWLR